MRTLIVGAGPLGRAFAARLATTSTVTFLVRPQRGAALTKGFDVKDMSGKRTARVVPDAVLDDLRDVARTRWDAVLLTVPSPALREPWIAELAAAIGESTVITTGQGIADLPALHTAFAQRQLVTLVPTAFAFGLPIGSAAPVTTGFWFPPGSAAAWGDAERVASVVAALRASGIRARRVGRSGAGELLAATSIPAIASAQVNGWVIDRASAREAAAAATQARAIVAAVHGARASTVRATVIRIAFRIVPRLAPFDFLAYARHHFDKAAPQTVGMLDEWILEGMARSLPVSALSELRTRLRRHLA